MSSAQVFIWKPSDYVKLDDGPLLPSLIFVLLRSSCARTVEKDIDSIDLCLSKAATSYYSSFYITPCNDTPTPPSTLYLELYNMI